MRGPAKIELLSDPVHGEEQVVAISVLGGEAQNALQRVLGAGGAQVSALPQDERRLERVAFGTGELVDSERGLCLWRRPVHGRRDAWQTCGRCGRLWRTLGRNRSSCLLLVTPCASVSGCPACGPRSGLGMRPCRWMTCAPPSRTWIGCLICLTCRKPYFVGQFKLPRPDGVATKRAFAWTGLSGQPGRVPVRRTPLYEEHLALGAKMIEFAGWEMPVWYSSVGEEHLAVRERAGLFDVGHMGTIEVAGPHAVEFLDLVSVNYAWWLKDGESQYSGLARR